MRFSLRWLFGVVFYAAFGCALLTYGSDPLIAVCRLGFAVLSLIALLGAIFTRQQRRAFWVGYAVVAWSFVLTDTMPDNAFTPPTAIRTVLFQLSTGHTEHTGLFFYHLRGPAAEPFVAIGCSVAGGILAGRFRSRYAE